MDRNNEKRVVEEICNISRRCDYSNYDNLENVLSEVKGKDCFRQSIFGNRYIQRLTSLSAGSIASDCVLCGKEAINNVVCNVCIQKISKINKQNTGSVEPQQVAVSVNNQVERKEENKVSSSDYVQKIDEDITIEELFKDMDDSLLQLASQGTVKSIRRLCWVNIALGIVNFIMVFFLALFLWKFITTQ